MTTLTLSERTLRLPRQHPRAFLAGGVDVPLQGLELFADGTRPVVHVFTLSPPVPTSFYTVTPCRLIDTRNAAGPLGGPALGGQAPARVFTISGTCSIPQDARSLSLNVTVVQATSAGNLRLHPGSSSRPLVSTVNFVAGQTRANNAVVPLDAFGQLAVFDAQPAGESVHLVVDVNGYFR